MTGNIVFCAFWVLCISNIIKSTNAAPLVNDDPLQNNYGSLSQKQKDCKVKERYENKNWSGETIPFTVYIEDKEDGAVSFSITYDGEDISLFRDKIILSQKINNIYKYRNGDMAKKSLETYMDVSGWTQLEISMNDQNIIVKVMGIEILNHTTNFPVKGLVIFGKHITICEDKTPTWLVHQDVFAKIPLEPSKQVVDHSGNRTYVLSLSSEEKYTPCIGIGGNRKCLAQEHLMENKLHLYLELITGFINVYQEIGRKREHLTSFYKYDMKFIEVSSDLNMFSASLNIFNQPKVLSPDSVTPFNSNNGTVIYLCIGIGMTIGMVLSSIVAIVVMVLRRKLQASNTNNSTKTVNKNDSTNESTPFTH